MLNLTYDMFSVEEDITRSSPVKQANAQEAAKDSVTDLFDPLLTDSNFRMLLEIMSRNPIWRVNNPFKTFKTVESKN